MTTRKRKAEEEELQALPSDESEEEEEYVLPSFFSCHCRVTIATLVDISLTLRNNQIPEFRRGVSWWSAGRR